MLPSQNYRPAANWIALALVALPPLAIFAPVLFQDRSLAFRDTAVFYYPLFEWIEQQWQQGELPLWNPHANFGTPLVGEASSSMFYPGKAILLLPLEFSWKFKLYVVGHVFLAAGGAFYAARKYGASMEGAALAATSYACGGAVLFQYCNVVFLVGAAWLPWAFAAIETMLSQRSYSGALALGVALAMMTLGGDPQMAYHAGLAAAAYAAGMWWSERGSPIESEVRLPGRILSWLGGSLASSGRLLATAALTSFLLSAVQTFPAAEAASQSDRAAYHAPRNVYEGAKLILSEQGNVTLAAEGLFRDPEPETHAASIYQFSFAPWHLPEYLWPNFSGRYFPQYRRWMMAWPEEPRMWSQSVYLGLLPVLLAVGSLRLRRGSVRQRWLSWCVVLTVLGSFGAFGVGWLLRVPLAWSGNQELAARLPGDQVGGVYWFLVTFLPSYAYFRYPAKLLTFAAFPLCLLAAQGLDRLATTPRPRLQWVLLAIAAASGVAVICVPLAAGWFARLSQAIGPDSAYGPFDQAGSRRDLFLSFVHTLVVASLLFLLLNRRERVVNRRIAWSLVGITAAELVIANAPLIGTAPSDLWRERPLLSALLERDRRERGDQSMRPTVRQAVEQDTTDPSDWHASSSPLRLEELAAADRHLQRTNHSLAGPIDSLDCLTTLRLADYTYFYKRQRDDNDSFWGNYRILPQDAPTSAAAGENPWTPLASPSLAELSRSQLFRHEKPFPRAWIVHDVTVLPELRSRDPQELSLRGAEVAEKRVGQHVVRRDFRREAVVETGVTLDLPATSADDRPEAAHSCQVVLATPNRVVIDVATDSPALLVLGDTFFSGWSAKSESNSQPLAIVRTDRMFRGVVLATGRDRITFEYRPRSLYLGAIISGVGWMALLVCMAMRAKGLAGQAATLP